MTSLYFVVGGLVALSLVLYLVLQVLHSKNRKQAKERRKHEAMQAVVDGQPDSKHPFTPSTINGE